MSKQRIASFVFFCALVAASTHSVPQAAAYEPESLDWKTDYAEAMDVATTEKKMMLVYFFDPAKAEAGDEFAPKSIADPAVREKMSAYVLAKLPTSAEITTDNGPVKLLEHSAFEGLKRGPGLAVIDLANENTEYYGHVVSELPFRRGKYYVYRPAHLPVLLDLPPGTITQRMMVFAVRTHPEAPASTQGEQNPVLVDEAKQASHHQANIRVQGHHNWDNRSPRILGRLLGLGRRRYTSYPVEVCAESWPNQDLVDSCVDCVASWRQSEGHWSAVKAQQASYGYDIRRGSNGIWYATGIFAN